MKKNIFILMMIFLMIFIPNISLAVSANNPVLTSGLTPVISDGSDFSETEYTNEHWFDYENGNWANAKTDDGSIYVWIPRFTYKIEDDKISIKWSHGKNDDISDGYLRHPAFYFGGYNGGDPNSNVNFNERNGERRELTGFWVQKYLATTDNGYIQSLYNGTPAKNDLFSVFDASIKMTSNTAYGFTQSGTYTNLIKASQWGAISYLTAAKGNANSNVSTTGNVYGVYDMKSSTPEFVSAVIGTPDNAANLLNENYSRYIDVITLENDNNELNNTIRLEDYYGFGFSETNSIAASPRVVPYYTDGDKNNAYFIRGGAFGLFGYGSANGEENNIGFRTTISILTEELNNEIAFFDTEASVIEGDYLVIGVDFTVNKPWNFIDVNNDNEITNEDLFKRDSEGNANIDLECIYGTGEWTIKDLNASFIKLIREDSGNLIVEDGIPTGTLPAGKYTMAVRVGGRIGTTPVFRKIENLTAKIIVNKIMLDASGTEIKIGNIANNKVLLNIYGETGTSFVTEVKLKTAPTKTDYALNESLSLAGGTIVPILGNLEGAPINLTIHNVVNPSITSTPGNDKLVDLVYNGMTVIQDEVKFLINVSDIPNIKVIGKVEPEGIGTILRGSGEYKQLDTDEDYNLVSVEYLNSYKFKSWESSSKEIIPKSSSEYETTFTIPSKNVNIIEKDVVFTAKYIAPNNLKVINPQTEFIIGDEFTFGEDAQIIVTYPDNSTKIIPPSTLGLTSDPTLGEELNTEGEVSVKVEYGDLVATYDIEVVAPKHNLIVEINDSLYGEILGSAKDKKSVQKATISLPSDDEIVKYYSISSGNMIYLEVVSKEGYIFKEWIVSDENAVLGKDLTKSPLTFTMPNNDIRVKGVFEKVYKITYKVENNEHGKINGEAEQFVVKGGSTSEVIATPNDKYAFNYWKEDGSKEATRRDSNIKSDATYTAIFTNIWTVTFYNEDTLFKEITVRDGESGNISDIPTKYAYVFTGWDKDLSSITEDTVTYAKFVPRISITDEKAIDNGYISAHIVGTMIEDGTLQYIISDSPTDPGDEYFNYELEGATVGDWSNRNELYASKEGLLANQDSSSYLILNSLKAKEKISFYYMIAAGDDSQLGITINDEVVITPDETSSSWKEFSEEVDVIDGKIKVGISYSQGEIDSSVDNDYAAIRNLCISREWTIIDNDYYLEIPAVYKDNYIHVKGIGSDDGELYTAVSEKITVLGALAPEGEASLTWNWTTTDDLEKEITVVADSETTIYWGDYTTTTISAGVNNLTHTYSSNSDMTSYKVSVEDDVITKLDVQKERITSLDVSNNTKLETLSCTGNEIIDLDVSNNIVLTELYCGGNELISLDIRNNEDLSKVCCVQESLESLYLTSTQNTNMAIVVEDTPCDSVANNTIHVSSSGIVTVECEHVYGSWKWKNLTYHVISCTLCGHEKSSGYHNTNGSYYGNYSYHWKTCSICYGQAEAREQHTIVSGGYAQNTTHHWLACSKCLLQCSDKEEHKWVDGYCGICWKVKN